FCATSRTSFASARADLPRALLPAYPCRGGWAPGPRHRPVRLGARRAGQYRRHRPADAARARCIAAGDQPGCDRAARRQPRAAAASVVGIDRSEPALALAEGASRRNDVAERCTFRRAEVFAEAAALSASGERFDIVIADPPPFARSKRDVGPALRGYRKLARLAAQVTAPGGILFLASCSH